MRELGLIVLFVLLFVSSILYGEIEYSISEATTLTVPYPFETTIYECAEDTLVHFYNTVIENEQINLYHFTLNDSMQFSSQSIIVSVDTNGLNITGLILVPIYNSDTILVYYAGDSKLVTRILNYDQLDVTVDLSLIDDELVSGIAVSDSLLLLTKKYQEGEWQDRYSEFYKLNLDTEELTLIRTNESHLAAYGILGEYVIAFGDYNSGYLLYDNELNLIDNITINDEYSPGYDPVYNNPPVDEFWDGYLFAFTDGVLDRQSWYLTYAHFVPGELNLEFIAYYKPDLYKVLTENKIVGISESWPDGFYNRISYSEYNGSTWNESQLIVLENGIYNLFNLQGYIILATSNASGITFDVYDYDLNLVHQQIFPSSRLDSQRTENYFDKLMFISSYYGIISYYTFSTTVHNSEDTNPEIVKSITATNYPNPFNPETTIEYSIPEAGQVDITVYNLRGQKVNTLVNDSFSRGTHSIVWNGTDKNNNTLSSGVYIYRVEQNGKSTTNKIVLMK